MDLAPFDLAPQLAADTVPLGDWTLSRVLLMDELAWPWLILVPRRAGLRELHDLAAADLAILAGEIARASAVLQAATGPDKINVGMLGNRVPQLHVHVIARRAGDPAWPGPVWGHKPREALAPEARIALADTLKAALFAPGAARGEGR